MKSHFISHVKIEGLWGDKSFSIPFFDNVNVIIGPNASGKTTIINILMYALTGNLSRLFEYAFDSVEITLTSFANKKKLNVRIAQTNDKCTFEIGGKSVPLPPVGNFSAFLSQSSPAQLAGFRRHFSMEFSAIRTQLAGLVPAAWLPVSRRLPITEEDEEDRKISRRSNLESVDECLSQLLSLLRNYRISLDSTLSELRKEFQKHALENILYDKSHDAMPDFVDFPPLTENDKTRLLEAFRDVGLADKEIEARVDGHFDAAEKALEQLRIRPNSLPLSTVFVIPLIHRTKQMLVFAKQLEEERMKLFAPLNLYQQTINDFMGTNKILTVTSKGDLNIDQSPKRRDLNWRLMSSGEKQLLILLTQALVYEKDPVVYVADEPELSLHVTWQERLLKAITSLAGRCQLIVATHSPDIAGAFPDNIIDLGRL